MAGTEEVSRQPWIPSGDAQTHSPCLPKIVDVDTILNRSLGLAFGESSMNTVPVSWLP